MGNSSVAMIVLASASPRRSALLDQLGVGHEIVAAQIDERRLPGEAPELFVERLALAKARLVQARLDRSVPVLGADTVVAVDGEVLGKPRDRGDALGMLARLSGREHRVLSAVALVDGAREAVRLNVSHVWFRPIGDDEARRYWATGEPADKAGAYAVQGLGALFVARLEGSYSGVMGLPLFETAALLKEFGIAVL